jgi:hypothetical protein
MRAAMPARNVTMSKPKVKNPFYVLLLVVGTLFALTACGYGAMTVRMIEPHEFTPGDRFFDTYGLWLMVGQLGLLAVLTFLAIGTDNYWVRRAEAKHKEESKPV